jgi:hypothetical protein
MGPVGAGKVWAFPNMTGKGEAEGKACGFPLGHPIPRAAALSKAQVTPPTTPSPSLRGVLQPGEQDCPAAHQTWFQGTL